MPAEKTEKTSLKSLKTRRDELNGEFRDLATESAGGNSAALGRRSEISKELRALSAEILDREPDVEVQVPRSTTGHPFRVGEAIFWPGRHTVKKSVAQHLCEMIDKNREAELNRMRQNGTEIDLGAIGDKARQLDERGI